MQIINFSGYEFYEDGSIYSYKSNSFLKPRLGKDGYLNVSCIDDDGNKKTHSLNNWICRAFHGDPPFEHADAMHIDENRFNCSADNLRWASHKENINYGKRSMLNAQAHYKRIGQYDLNNNLIQIFDSIKEASEYTSVSYTGIIKCAKGKIHTSGNYIWHYI